VSVDTCSTLGRVGACPPSAVLPHVQSSGEDALLGLGMHEHMDHRAKFGLQTAMERVDAIAKKFAMDERQTGIFRWKCRTFEWSPPPGSFGEVALAMREDGTVDRVQLRVEDHQYLELDGSPLRADTLFCGTLDCMWSEPEPLDLSDPERPRCLPGVPLWVIDYKDGNDANVSPVDTNAQIAALAVMAAKWTGAQLVVPGIVFLRPPGGEWDTPDGIWGPAELAKAEARIREIVRRRREAKAKYEAGEPLTYFEGPHCTYCHAQTFCPAKVALLKAVLGTPVPKKGAQLTEDERIFWARNITYLRGLVEKYAEFMKDDVRKRGPIVIDEKLAWGPVATPTTFIRAKRALPILEEELGEELAANAIKMSKKAIEDAVKADHAAKGIERKRAAVMRDILAKLKEVDAIGTTTSVTFTTYRTDRDPAQLGAGDDEEAA